MTHGTRRKAGEVAIGAIWGVFLDTLPTGVPGVPPRRRLPDPGVLQGTVTTPICRTQGSDHVGVMQALVRIQAYMLADIVVAIPALDLVV